MALYQKLLSGHNMPSIGLGTSSALEETLEAALEAGYRHIDTAYGYRNSEEVIGKVLQKWFSSGKLKREDIFIVTKLPRDGVHPSKVEYFLKESLKRLQLDYVDLYLIHYPVYILPGTGTGTDRVPGEPAPTDHIGTWKKMEEQVDAGRAKSIGLSNFSTQQIDRIWQAARIKPSCIQTLLTPFIQDPKLVKYCQDKGIAVTGYSMLATRRGDNQEETFTNSFTNSVIIRIAEKYNKSIPQIILRFFLQKNIICIPKSRDPERVKNNIDVFNFSLDSDDMKDIESLHIGSRARGKEHGGATEKLRNHPEFPIYED